jgi:flotillin
MDYYVWIIIGIAVVLVICIIASGYIKAPPDRAFIISGLRKKIVIGKSAIKIPFLERLDKLSLQLIQVDVKTSSSVPTADYINVNVDANVNIKISDKPDLLRHASQNFLNKDTQYICAVAREVLEGNTREIVGQMKLQELVNDRQKFAEKVLENARPDLEKIGLEILNFNVQKFTDEKGVIEDLGIDNVSQIKKNASIAKANAERDVAIAQSQAKNEANTASVQADTTIAERENQLALKKAELKRKEDTAKAEADAAYDIQKEEQRKTIETKTADANIVKQEKEIEIKKREVQVQEEHLNAVVVKQADADRYQRQQAADASLYERQKAADAEKFEREREAEAILVQKQNEAKGILAVGEAEAKAVQLKGEAEAAAMEKKAIAYERYGRAAMAEMIVKVLPEVAMRIAEPLTRIDKISIIGGDASGVNSIAGNVPAVMARTFESIKQATGIDLADIMRADTYDAKVTKNLNISGAGIEVNIDPESQEG